MCVCVCVYTFDKSILQENEIRTNTCVCVCVYVCVCVDTFDKSILEEEEIRYPRKSVYFWAIFYISNKYIIVSVIQVESIQGNLTDSRSLNRERIARDQNAITSSSYLST